MFAESILDFRNTQSPSSGSKKKKKRKIKSSGFIDEIDNVRVNLESSFVLQMSDDSVEIQAANMRTHSSSNMDPIVTPPSPYHPAPPPPRWRRRSSSGSRRGKVGGPYLAGDNPSNGRGRSSIGIGQRASSIRRGKRGLGRLSNVDILLRDSGIPLISDRICKTCEMGYEGDENDITHCGHCRRKLHKTCYNGDGCRNCNYDPSG